MVDVGHLHTKFVYYMLYVMNVANDHHKSLVRSTVGCLRAFYWHAKRHVSCVIISVV